MSERRSLVEGIKPAASLVDPNIEKAFVFGAKSTGVDEPSAPANSKPVNNISRSPLSTRVRSDLAAALKRASLERQLNNIEPHSLQDILEVALEDWLRANG